MKRVRSLRPVFLATMLAMTLSASVAVAQAGPEDAFAIDVSSGSVSGDVSMVGAAIAPIDDTSYWFSDGTDVISVSIDGLDTDAGVPLLTLIAIQGVAADGQVEVGAYTFLDLMTPAVIRTPEEAVEAFQTWIITQNSQAPVE